jgi:hypothetical protein
VPFQLTRTRQHLPIMSKDHRSSTPLLLRFPWELQALILQKLLDECESSGWAAIDCLRQTSKELKNIYLPAQKRPTYRDSLSAIWLVKIVYLERDTPDITQRARYVPCGLCDEIHPSWMFNPEALAQPFCVDGKPSRACIRHGKIQVCRRRGIEFSLGQLLELENDKPVIHPPEGLGPKLTIIGCDKSPFHPSVLGDPWRRPGCPKTFRARARRRPYEYRSKWTLLLTRRQ